MSASESITLLAQATEVELHMMALRDLRERAEAKRIKRTEHDIESLRKRETVAFAAAQTLYGLAKGRLS